MKANFQYFRRLLTINLIVFISIRIIIAIYLNKPDINNWSDETKLISFIVTVFLSVYFYYQIYGRQL